MADTVTTKTVPTGILGDGVNPPNVADPTLYQLTPKYNDPQLGSASRIARFFLSQALINQINSTFSQGTGSGITLSGTDTVLQKLSNPNSGYFEFFLQGVEEVFSERYQIMETLGDNYAVFGIGKKPRIFNFRGGLINSIENDWRISFIYLFQQFISISRLAKFGGGGTPNIVTLKYDSVFVQGALLDFRTGIQAENELVAPFSFPMLITKFDFVDLTKLGADNTLTQSEIDGTSGFPQAQGMTLSTAIDDQTFALSSTKFAKQTSAS